MRQLEYMLSNAFEAVGSWWVPSNEKCKVSGTLRYSDKEIELDLNAPLPSSSASDAESRQQLPKSHSRIHGRMNDCRDVTLYYVTMKRLGDTFTFNVTFVIVDCWTEEYESTRLSVMSFYCNHLNSFFRYPKFDVRHDDRNGEYRETVVTYKHEEPIVWRVDSIESAIEFETGLSTHDHVLKIELHANSVITITPDKAMPLAWFIEQVGLFCDLLTLLTNESVVPTGYRLIVDGQFRDGWFLGQPERSKSKGRRPVSPTLLFQHDHLQEAFSSILGKWFSSTEIMRDSIHLMMDAFLNDDQSIDGRFLLLAHAVEVFSRATTTSLYMAVEEYEKVKDVLCKAIPEVTKGHRESLKNKIKFGNEFSFQKRIRQLISDLDTATKGLICKEPKNFAKGIADTRNYFTHFTDDLRSKALRGAALYWAAHKLVMLLRIRFLLHLGLDQMTIRAHILHHPYLGFQCNESMNHTECVKD